MIDQYFGVKELHNVVLRAKTPMQFGSRYLETDEPVLYFKNVSMSLLSEKNQPILARGGWANLPRVVWEDRSEVHFVISEGVMSSISMGVLLSANVVSKAATEPMYIHKVEGPKDLEEEVEGHGYFYLQHWPVDHRLKKTFIFEHAYDVAQKKVYGKRVMDAVDPMDGTVGVPCLDVFEDKECTICADMDKQYIVDYYYEYDKEALVYTIQKERFNGLFSLEGEFYSKDENKGLNYTNIIYMPRVRVVSDINLRLGERADPTMSVFNIIAMPESVGGSKKSLILEITRLNEDLDDDEDI